LPIRFNFNKDLKEQEDVNGEQDVELGGPSRCKLRTSKHRCSIMM